MRLNLKNLTGFKFQEDLAAEAEGDPVPILIDVNPIHRPIALLALLTLDSRHCYLLRFITASFNSLCTPHIDTDGFPRGTMLCRTSFASILILKLDRLSDGEGGVLRASLVGELVAVL